MSKVNKVNMREYMEEYEEMQCAGKSKISDLKKKSKGKGRVNKQSKQKSNKKKESEQKTQKKLFNAAGQVFDAAGQSFNTMDVEELIDSGEMKDVLGKSIEFRYQLLDRLRNDCNYYLGAGNHYAKCLWALDEKTQIAYMKALWNNFSDFEKPEWLSYDDILRYEEQMILEDERAVERVEELRVVLRLFEEAFEYRILEKGPWDTVYVLVGLENPNGERSEQWELGNPNEKNEKFIKGQKEQKGQKYFWTTLDIRKAAKHLIKHKEVDALREKVQNKKAKVAIAMELGYSKVEAIRGYQLCSDETVFGGATHIRAIQEVGAFNTDEEAAAYAESYGDFSIIHDLPEVILEKIDRKYFEDTLQNRRLIKGYLRNNYGIEWEFNKQEDCTSDRVIFKPDSEDEEEM